MSDPARPQLTLASIRAQSEMNAPDQVRPAANDGDYFYLVDQLSSSTLIMKDAAEDIATLLAHRAVLREALQHFFDVWPEVEKGINSAFVMAHIHGGHYTGPQLPIDEMRAALSSGEGRTQEEETKT